MPSPGMVQLDPAQKQAPAVTDAFDAKQIQLQAKTDVNLLIEKSKSELQSSKHESLQILSSFPVPIKEGHEWETRETYRRAVCDANDLLRKEGAPIAIWLEDVGDKFHIVTGRYEEKESTIVQSEKREPMVAQNEGGEKTAPVERTPIVLTDEDHKNRAITKEELEHIAPDELTANQWSVVQKLLDKISRDDYSLPFDRLFPSQKIDVIRKMISPSEIEGKEIGFVSAPSRELHKAAETFSTLKGDCDDLSLLYIACVKKLDKSGEFKIEGVKLAVVVYYDPDKKDVLSHANVIQISMKNKDEKKPDITTFLVDLTYLPSNTNLKLKPDAVNEGSVDLKGKLLEHMNEDRVSDEKKIKKELTELILYDGYVGRETPEGKDKFAGAKVYYCENNSIFQLEEADKLGEEAMKLYNKSKCLEAIPIFEAADRIYEKVCADLSDAIKTGNANGTYCGDVLVRLADAQAHRYTNLTRWGSALDITGDSKTGHQKEDDGEEQKKLSALSYGQAISVDGLSSYASNRCAKYLSKKTDYATAENIMLQAISAAPFKPELYETYYEIMVKDSKKEEADKRLGEFNAQLVGFGVQKNSEGSDAISVIEKLIK